MGDARPRPRAHRIGVCANQAGLGFRVPVPGYRCPAMGNVSLLPGADTEDGNQ